MVCAGGCNSVFCIYFNHLFKYQRKIYRGCGGTFGWTDVPFPVTERSGDDGRCDNRFDQLLDLHYIQSRYLLFSSMTLAVIAGTMPIPYLIRLVEQCRFLP